MSEIREKLLTNACHLVYFHEVIFFDEFKDHLEKLRGVKITEFDGVIKIWIEFNFLGYKFFLNNRSGDYWFWVENPRLFRGSFINYSKALLQYFETLEAENSKTGF